MPPVSQTVHCEVLALLEPHLRATDANLAEIWAALTEVIASIVMRAPLNDRTPLIGSTIGELGSHIILKTVSDPAAQAAEFGRPNVN